MLGFRNMQEKLEKIFCLCILLWQIIRQQRLLQVPLALLYHIKYCGFCFKEYRKGLWELQIIFVCLSSFVLMLLSAKYLIKGSKVTNSQKVLGLHWISKLITVVTVQQLFNFLVLKVNKQWFRLIFWTYYKDQDVFWEFAAFFSIRIFPIINLLLCQPNRFTNKK